MFPEIFVIPENWPLIGGLTLHTYGLFVALGFLAGMYWVQRESVRVGLPPNRMLDLVFYMIVASIVGSRILYVLIDVEEWWKNPLVFFKIWEGGLVFYGGLVACLAFAIWYCRRHGFAFLKVADVFAPGIALGHSLGRLGCFTAGCCYGKSAAGGSFLSVVFPRVENQIAPYDHPVYATQLMESFGLMAIFLVLFLISRRKKFTGQVFLAYLVMYSLLRSAVEVFRGDAARGFLIEDVLSTSQFISLLLILSAIVTGFYLYRKNSPRR